eukprot:3014290-Pyramimonas_sp.AAC.1
MPHCCTLMCFWSTLQRAARLHWSSAWYLCESSLSPSARTSAARAPSVGTSASLDLTRQAMPSICLFKRRFSDCAAA